jgi:predicted RNA-binding Zn-ribbon protein involved in translation (DUF1610 family)
MSMALDYTLDKMLPRPPSWNKTWRLAPHPCPECGREMVVYVTRILTDISKTTQESTEVYVSTWQEVYECSDCGATGDAVPVPPEST